MRRQVKGDAVRRELLPGESPKLLRELHLLTRDGNLNADALRKLKQVNHLVGLLAPAVEDVLGRFGDPAIADCGAGKSYLGFILYELFLQRAGKGTLWSIEPRAELARAAEERAVRLGFGRMRFLAASIDAVAVRAASIEAPAVKAAPIAAAATQAASTEAAELPARLHLVTALHACDTATDDAIALAVNRDADHVAVVPCCQAEVARQLDRAPEGGPLAALHERPWHRREFGSHLTNVVRALALEARGYRVTVTELAGWEHSLKNELILGKKVRARNPQAEEKLKTLLAAAGVRPKVARLLDLCPPASA